MEFNSGFKGLRTQEDNHPLRSVLYLGALRCFDQTKCALLFSRKFCRATLFC